MLQPNSRAVARPPPLALSELQFVSIEIAPSGDGSLWVSSTGTYVDDAKLEFFNDEIEHTRVPSLDDALAVIRKIVAEALFSQNQKEGH